MILRLWNKIVNIVMHACNGKVFNIFYPAVFMILEKALRIENCSKLMMEVTVKKGSRKYKPTELSWLQIAFFLKSM